MSFLDRSTYDCQTRLQPVDGAAGGTLHPSVHRPGLRLQRVQPADDASCSASRSRRPDDWNTDRAGLDLLDRRSSCSASRRRSSAAGSRTAARARRCSPRLCAGPSASSSRAFGVYIHNLWLVYLGYGVIGGCGLGIGYISPVSTLIKWFPDRPGMATGMAIMGFGGGAFIASPLSVWLMAKFSTPTHVGVCRNLPRHGRRSTSSS